jgi:hypothetical protein
MALCTSDDMPSEVTEATMIQLARVALELQDSGEAQKVEAAMVGGWAQVLPDMAGTADGACSMRIILNIPHMIHSNAGIIFRARISRTYLPLDRQRCSMLHVHHLSGRHRGVSCMRIRAPPQTD